MKNSFLLISIVYFLLLTISCSKLEREKDILELDKSAITINQEGGEEFVELTSNDAWEIQDIPEWLSVSPFNGDYSDVICITAKENNESARRQASLLFSRGKINKTLEVEQLGLEDVAPFIEFSRNQIEVSNLAGTQTVKLTTNRPWEIYFVPNWISVTPSSGNKSTEITIRIAENRSPDKRLSKVVFSGDFGQESLEVSQSGLRDIVMSPGLSIFSFKRLKYDTELNWCDVWADSLFINPAIRDKIYLGNLISHNAPSNTDIPEFTGYTFNPVTISAWPAIEGGAKTYIPSQMEQESFAKEVIGKLQNRDEEFNLHDNAVEFYSHRQLHTVGVISMGVKLDEVVSGTSFLEKEMTRKYGLLYSFKRIFFKLNMDIPTKLIQEELKNTDAARGVSFVSSVSYGKVGLLVIESDTDSRDVRDAINHIIRREPLSQEEVNLLSTVDVCYVCFDSDKNVQMKKGNIDVVEAYREGALNGTDNIYPVEFSLSNYPDNLPGILSFGFRIGD